MTPLAPHQHDRGADAARGTARGVVRRHSDSAEPLSHRLGSSSPRCRRPARAILLPVRVGHYSRVRAVMAAPRAFLFELSHHVCQDLAESTHHVHVLSSVRHPVGYDANENGLTHGTRSLPPDGKTYD